MTHPCFESELIPTSLDLDILSQLLVSHPGAQVIPLCVGQTLMVNVKYA